MFTGIITDIGRVRRVLRTPDLRLEISTAFDVPSIDMGASVCHNGICLTVVEKGTDWFAVEASAETEARTNISAWTEGSPVNLERSLCLGDELGGHLVYGHVDGLATLVSRQPDGESVRFTFDADRELGGFIATKGSVALDGVSLTVNEVADTAEGRTRFGVNIIPHTLKCTTFSQKQPGDRLNLEVDMLARYVARLTTRG
jgi:riboflavin synthase